MKFTINTWADTLDIFGFMFQYLMKEDTKDWEYIIIHHSATPITEKGSWESITKFHTSWAIDGHIVSEAEYNRIKKAEPKGHWFKTPYKDNGYHFGIDSINGKPVYKKGRPINMSGGHAGTAWNNKSLGVCMVGDYDKVSPSDELLKSLWIMVKGLMAYYKIPKDKVITHREANFLAGATESKTCAGLKFSIDKFRELL